MRLYVEQFPSRRVLNPKTFERVDQRLRQTNLREMELVEVVPETYVALLLKKMFYGRCCC